MQPIDASSTICTPSTPFTRKNIAANQISKKWVGPTDGPTEGPTDGLKDGPMDGLTDGRTDQSFGVQIGDESSMQKVFVYLFYFVSIFCLCASCMLLFV